MAIQLGLSGAHHHPLGVRCGDERRRGERRSSDRGGADRRKAGRRRATFHSLLISALTIGYPHPTARTASRITPAPLAAASSPAADVTTSIDSFITVSMDAFVVAPPWRPYDGLIREAATRYHLDAALIRAVIQAESAFNPLAVSNAGAVGLMQLMPKVALEMGVHDPFDPRENVMAGARQLRRLLDLQHGDIPLAVASYNAGADAVARYGGTIPPFAETQHFVVRVIHLLRSGR